MMPKKVLDDNIFYLFNDVVSSDQEYDFNMLDDKDIEKANFFQIKKLTHSYKEITYFREIIQIIDISS